MLLPLLFASSGGVIANPRSPSFAERLALLEQLQLGWLQVGEDSLFDGV